MSSVTCIFCRRAPSEAAEFTTREHVIPEAMGNTELILGAGVVCDSCNSYFGRKVEKIFLESPAIVALRHEERIPNKRGRIPSLPVKVGSQYAGVMNWSRSETSRPILVLPMEAAIAIARDESSRTLVHHDRDDLEISANTVQFVGKMALECLAVASLADDVDLIETALTPAFDPLRAMARFGRGADRWPLRMSRIHGHDQEFVIDEREIIQITWNYQILPAPSGDVYFAIALFGLEFVINMGRPEIAGYGKWLATSGVSTLLVPPKPPVEETAR